MKVFSKLTHVFSPNSARSYGRKSGKTSVKTVKPQRDLNFGDNNNSNNRRQYDDDESSLNTMSTSRSFFSGGQNPQQSGQRRNVTSKILNMPEQPYDNINNTGVDTTARQFEQGRPIAQTSPRRPIHVPRSDHQFDEDDGYMVEDRPSLEPRAPNTVRTFQQNPNLRGGGDDYSDDDDESEDSFDESSALACNKLALMCCIIVLGVIIVGVSYFLATGQLISGTATAAVTVPTIAPTMFPTTPTNVPTSSPSSPTVSPTARPSESPVLSPTISPTLRPTEGPTHSPTHSPTTVFSHVESICEASSQEMRTAVCLDDETWVRCEKDGSVKMVNAQTGAYIRNCEAGDVCPCGERIRVKVSDPCVLASDQASSGQTCVADT